MLGDDGSYLELMSDAARDAGTHFSERSADVDARPLSGTILVFKIRTERRRRREARSHREPGMARHG